MRGRCQKWVEVQKRWLIYRLDTCSDLLFTLVPVVLQSIMDCLYHATKLNHLSILFLSSIQFLLPMLIHQHLFSSHTNHIWSWKRFVISPSCALIFSSLISESSVTHCCLSASSCARPLVSSSSSLGMLWGSSLSYIPDLRSVLWIGRRHRSWRWLQNGSSSRSRSR